MSVTNPFSRHKGARDGVYVSRRPVVGRSRLVGSERWMIYSGLDWSEDAGQPVVGYMAMVHVDGEAEMSVLETELAMARARLGYSPNHIFKHTEAKAAAHDEFFLALTRVPSLSAHVYRYSRTGWTARFPSPALGDACVCDALIALTLSCPRHLVERQTLLIDLPRRERAVVLAYATVLRNSMKGLNQRSFGKIQPRPDDRLAGGIVQAADMIAGEVRQHSGATGPYLARLGRRITLI